MKINNISYRDNITRTAVDGDSIIYSEASIFYNSIMKYKWITWIKTTKKDSFIYTDRIKESELI